jgi:predicted phage terminase large subunit-like protein
MKQTAQKDQAKYGGLVTIWIEQEGTAGGKESAEGSVKDLAGYTVRVEPAVSAKDIRAEPLAAQAEAGNVVLIEGAWNGTFLEERCAFPNGKNDDMVDAASGAFNKLALGRSLFREADRRASISDQIPIFIPRKRGAAIES